MNLGGRLGKIGLGCATFGREIDAGTAFTLMDHAVARGVTHFDTAAAYSNGASETIVGAWLASRRPAPGTVLVATKIKPPYTPGAIRGAIAASRERLGGAPIELLYLHQWNDELVNPASLAALDSAIRRGEVTAIGASNLNANQLGALLALQEQDGLKPLQVLQNNHNFAIRDVDAATLDVCAHARMALVTYSPLGAGFLTGKHRNGVEPGSRFDVVPGHQKVYFNRLAWERLARLEVMSQRTGQSLPTMALAWAFNQPGPRTVLVGGRAPQQIEQALQTLALGRPGWLEELDQE
jgi:aryl-alcohol dehydrogenase-like predicted oxidoreductase